MKTQEYVKLIPDYSWNVMSENWIRGMIVKSTEIEINFSRSIETLKMIDALEERYFLLQNECSYLNNLSGDINDKKGLSKGCAWEQKGSQSI